MLVCITGIILFTQFPVFNVYFIKLKYLQSKIYLQMLTAYYIADRPLATSTSVRLEFSFSPTSACVIIPLAHVLFMWHSTTKLKLCCLKSFCPRIPFLSFFQNKTIIFLPLCHRSSYSFMTHYDSLPLCIIVAQSLPQHCIMLS